MASKDKNDKNLQQDGIEGFSDQDVQFFSQMFGDDVKVEEIDNEDVQDLPQYTEPEEVIVRREKTRGLLALVFILGFFFVIFAGFLLVASSDAKLEDKATNLKDILITTSGIISGPLGFVVGYYFRKQDEEDE